MKIGFYTSTFSDRPVEEVLDFARDAGFDAIELDVNGHIKTPDKVAPVVAKARERGLFVASITFFGNQLDPDAGKRKDLDVLPAKVGSSRCGEVLAQPHPPTGSVRAGPACAQQAQVRVEARDDGPHSRDGLDPLWLLMPGTAPAKNRADNRSGRPGRRRAG